MVDLDDRLRHDLARLRARAGPPVAAEERVLAALRATIGGGDPGSGGPSQGASLAEAGIDIGHVAKVIAATAAITSAGLLLIKLTALVLQPAPTRVDASASESVTREPVTREPVTREPPEPRASPRLDPESPPLDKPAAAPTPSSTKLEARVGAEQGDPLAAELALVERARRVRDPLARLRLLERHHERFASGVLGPEADALTIAALCELDRIREAQAAADQFLRDQPRSPLRARIREACPQLDIPGGPE